MVSRKRESPESRELSREELLNLEIDTRLAETWSMAWDISDWHPEIVGALLRFAYSTGYRDALTEQRRGCLYTDHGYEVPGSS